MTEKVKVMLPVEVDLHRIGDLLVTAFEGGANYWYLIDEFHPPTEKYRWDEEGQAYRHVDHPLSPDGWLVITTKDGDSINGSTRWRLDREALVKGLGTMARRYPRHFADWMGEQDDAETGDVFLQCCLFGEVIYG